jgi:hypothetical protein
LAIISTLNTSYLLQQQGLSFSWKSKNCSVFDIGPEENFLSNGVPIYLFHILVYPITGGCVADEMDEAFQTCMDKVQLELFKEYERPYEPR